MVCIKFGKYNLIKCKSQKHISFSIKGLPSNFKGFADFFCHPKGFPKDKMVEKHCFRPKKLLVEPFKLFEPSCFNNSI
jgi:hypothetical protein